ncbi:putative lipoprotein [Oxalobacteraceae bacterium IMCC9480]|nr:putative lipoprotein [Oxalobacteraceae bacterium IMCC9480]
MMGARSALIAASVAMLALAGCGEKSQEMSSSASKPDGKPWQGELDRYAAKGWEKGDKTKWELQLRARAQNQNEYVKSN